MYEYKKTILWEIWMNKTTRTQIVTTALPYANGAIHLGHILEAIEADIWVNFQKMRGNECYFIAGSDALK